MTSSQEVDESMYPKGNRTVLQAGTAAPDFKLRCTPDQWLSLSELRGQSVVLAFYPADWSPVCGDQLVLYNEVLPEFQEYGAALLGISVDGVWCHAAFARERKLHFPLLADFEPKGEVARLYGVYRQDDGVSERALFENQDDLDDEDLAQYAEVLGLDARHLLAEIHSGVRKPRVREDFRSGIRSGVNGTPTFFINGARYDGERLLEEMLAALAAAAVEV